MPLPPKYIERIQETLPKSEWDCFFANVTKPLPKTVRITPNYKDIPNFWHLTPTAIPNAFFIKRDNQDEIPLGKTLEHFTGKMYVASLSSLLPPIILNPQPGETVLDMCAAPGSKSTYLATLMNNSGTLITNEPSSSRSKKLVANLERMGIANYILLQSDGTKLCYYLENKFDKILLDTPCSSEGFSRKDSKFFDKMWAERKIFESAKLQKRLILSAFEMLKPEGEMVYSTCTSAPEENETIVQYLMDKYSGTAKILPINLPKSIPLRSGIAKFMDQTFDPEITKNTIRIWPHLETPQWSSETFFLAKIKKLNCSLNKQPDHFIKGRHEQAMLSTSKEAKTSININNTKKRDFGSTNANMQISPHKPKYMVTLLSKNRTAEILSRLKKNFGLERLLFKKYAFYEKHKEIWMIANDTISYLNKISHRRAGLPVFDDNGNLTTIFSIQFGIHATKNLFEINEEQKNKWMKGENLKISSNYLDTTEILVKYEIFCLGYGKIMKNGMILKNKLDRDLIF